MKKIIVVLLLCVSNVYSQNIEGLSPFQKKLYTTENIQVRPEFPKGNKAFDDFVKSNFEKSKIKKGLNISAKFIVEIDGSLSNIEITKDDGFGSGNELKRILEMSPKWLQGEHEGFHVRTIVNYTLEF